MTLVGKYLTACLRNEVERSRTYTLPHNDSINLRSAMLTLCQPYTSTTFAKLVFRCPTPAVWNLFRKLFSVVTLLQLFSLGFKLPGFLSFPCSLTRCLAPAPLKLRPNDAIQICLLLLRSIVMSTSVCLSLTLFNKSSQDVS